MTLEESKAIATSLHACATEGEGCKQCAYFKGEHSNCLNRLLLDASELLTRIHGVLDYHYYPDDGGLK